MSLFIAPGVPKHKIELWHHEVDGREHKQHFMDWPCTTPYVRQFASAFNVPLYFSWREGGFKREMLRDDCPTAQTHFETPTGILTRGGKGENDTRKMFPQISSNLSVRYCSSYLKIDVGSIALNNQPRFNDARTLTLSGERAEESGARRKLQIFQPDRSDARKGSLKRHVDRCRLVHQWREEQIWDIIARWRIQPHPAYRLGWSRVSCGPCIFLTPDGWASARVVLPEQFNEIVYYERQFGKTIDRTMDVTAKAALGKPYPQCSNAKLVAEARDRNWDYPIILPEGEWELPPGAFGENGGPT